MQRLQTLRLAVIGFLSLHAVLFALSFIEDESLPTVLRDWEHLRAAQPFPLSVAAFALINIFIGSVAILSRKKWGAWLHLVSTVVFICATAFMGVVVESAATDTIDSLSMIASGLIYGLAFFTDALSPAKKAPNQSPEPTATSGRGSL
jgi:TctA family transporter